MKHDNLSKSSFFEESLDKICMDSATITFGFDSLYLYKSADFPQIQEIYFTVYPDDMILCIAN